MATDKAMDDVKTAGADGGPRVGRFMGESARQSQPTQIANIRRFALKLPLFGTRETSLP